MSGRSFQRLGPAELFGRGVVAAITSGLMTVGAYPYVPAIAAARKRKQSLFARIAGRDLPREWALGFAASLARPLGFRGLPGSQSEGTRPVILAHGYAMGRSCFIPMAARLSAKGHGPIVGFEYWTLGSIADSARRLSRVVDRVLDATGADRVDIIGHSMGGVVSRYFTNLESGGDRVRHLITLGSPHAGSEVSFIGAGQMRRELRVGSPTLTRLAASAIPSGTTLTCIYSPIDVLVGSSRHSRIEGAEVHRLEDVGHMAMLTDRSVLELVLERLARDSSDELAGSSTRSAELVDD